MWIIRWFRDLVAGRKTAPAQQEATTAEPPAREAMTPDRVMSDCPITRMLVAQAINNQSMVIGNVDETGKLTVSSHPVKKDGEK